MPDLLFLSVIASAVVAASIIAVTAHGWWRRDAVRAVCAVLIAALVTTQLGRAVGAESTGFLVALAAGVAPIVLVLALAVRDVVGHRSRAESVLVGAWVLVVFPLSVVLPSIAATICGAPECRAEDFGGALALLVSSAACVLCGRKSGALEKVPSGASLVVLSVVVWVAGIFWLVSLEGVVDEYVPRIALAAVLAPVGGAAGWLVGDLLRRSPRNPVHSAALGTAAGLVAIVPGVATIEAPWSALVGVVAGVAAGGVAALRPVVGAGRVARAAIGVLVAAGTGYVAPAIWADTAGFIFSGRVGAMIPPLGLLAAAMLLGIVASVPAWILAHRDARRRAASPQS